MERYGLFKLLSDGAPLWVCAEETLAEAVAKMHDLGQKTGLEHFVHDFSEGTTVASSRTDASSPPSSQP